MQESIINQAHSFSAHLGARKTFSHLREYVWWLEMVTGVTAFCVSCITQPSNSEASETMQIAYIIRVQQAVGSHSVDVQRGHPSQLAPSFSNRRHMQLVTWLRDNSRSGSSTGRQLLRCYRMNKKVHYYYTYELNELCHGNDRRNRRIYPCP